MILVSLDFADPMWQIWKLPIDPMQAFEPETDVVAIASNNTFEKFD